MSRRKPYLSVAVLLLIVAGCCLAGWISPYDPQYMNLAEIGQAPGAAHLFGTDTLGRDIFSVVWYGGRISLFIGGLAALISTTIAVLYGCVAGLAGEWLDDALMRFSEILMSVPQILLVLFLQAMLGTATVQSMAVVIGITGWMAVAKMVRSEVKQVRGADYILAVKTMKGGFFYTLWNHFLPGFLPAILFMVVTNLGSAIAFEATLSFLGMGLPTHVISWGSLMSLSQKAMLSGCWWLLLIPGTVLVVTLVCITEIGEYMRLKNRRESLL